MLTDSDIIGRGGTPIRPRFLKGHADVLNLGNTPLEKRLLRNEPFKSACHSHGVFFCSEAF
jgi:hypothetical protein